jgi:hypothetical protein
MDDPNEDLPPRKRQAFPPTRRKPSFHRGEEDAGPPAVAAAPEAPAAPTPVGARVAALVRSSPSVLAGLAKNASFMGFLARGAFPPSIAVRGEGNNAQRRKNFRRDAKLYRLGDVDGRPTLLRRAVAGRENRGPAWREVRKPHRTTAVDPQLRNCPSQLTFSLAFSPDRSR